MIAVFLMALSLAMDALAVSVSCGLSVRGFRLRHALMLGIYFGAFQFLMPLMGWLLGSSVAGYISNVAPAAAFVLLAFIGGRMVKNAISPDDEKTPVPEHLTHGRVLLLSVATSIDALAAGFTLIYVDIGIWIACTVIGAVAFILSVLGGMLGGKLGSRFQSRAELFGGLVLIALGVKILLEHLFS